VLRSIGLFLGAGVVWLFLFSIPIGHGKTLYQLGQHYIIRTTPVQWLGRQIVSGYETTLEATEDKATGTSFKELPEKFSHK